MGVTLPTTMRDFQLEVFFSKWEFQARYHMTASDFESISMSELLAMASIEDREIFENLWLGYTQTRGAPNLCAQIAKTYKNISPDHILCCAGAGEGLYSIAKVLLSKHDHAIVPIPNYQSAETIPLSICSVTGVEMQYSPPASMNKNSWSIDIDKIRKAIQPNTKLLSLNLPHNPTGMLISLDELQDIITLCREHGIYILSDEVYRGVELNHGDQIPQIADIYERGISLNVLSKAYGLPGLRIGWIASPDHDLLQKIEYYKHYLSICNSGPSEILAMIALKARDRIFSRNHAIISANIIALETLFADYPNLVQWQRPMGGCVSYPKFTGPGDGETFCRKLREESGVLLLPSSIYASDLGPVPQDHFRIGVGRKTMFDKGLQAMRQHFDNHYREFRK